MAKTKALKKPPEAVLEFFREQGRRGGEIGGIVSSQNLTKAQRKERARQAGIASGEARRAAAEERKRLEKRKKREG